MQFKSKNIFFSIILIASLFSFQSCSPFYYYLLNDKEKENKNAFNQIVFGLLAIRSNTFGGNNATAGNAGTTTSSSAQFTYPWGGFTDENNGMIRFNGNAGTFGGQTYSTATLYFAKCSSGQTWDSATNTCSPLIPSSLRFCSATDNSCNDVGTLNLNGTGTSQAYSYCNGLTLAGRSWRVATKNEMKLTIYCSTSPTTISVDNGSSCSASGFKINTSLFPYDSGQVCRFWTATAVSATDGWYINYCTGLALSGQPKTAFEYVRCVSDGP